ERQRGECAEGLGKFDDASKHYLAAIRRDPGQVPPYVRQARLLRTRLDRADQADAVMDDLRKAGGDSVPALLALARYRRENGRAAEAGPDIEKAVRLEPDSAEVRLAAAEQELALDRPALAREHLRHGLDKNSTNLALIEMRARLEFRSGRPK